MVHFSVALWDDLHEMTWAGRARCKMCAYPALEYGEWDQQVIRCGPLLMRFNFAPRTTFYVRVPPSMKKTQKSVHRMKQRKTPSHLVPPAPHSSSPHSSSSVLAMLSQFTSAMTLRGCLVPELCGEVFSAVALRFFDLAFGVSFGFGSRRGRTCQGGGRCHGSRVAEARRWHASPCGQLTRQERCSYSTVGRRLVHYVVLLRTLSPEQMLPFSVHTHANGFQNTLS